MNHHDEFISHEVEQMCKQSKQSNFMSSDHVITIITDHESKIMFII